MIGYSRVTQKGQITIPADIRRQLGLVPSRRVVIVHDQDGAKVMPAPDFFSMAGALRTGKKFDVREMRKSAKKLVGTRHE